MIAELPRISLRSSRATGPDARHGGRSRELYLIQPKRCESMAGTDPKPATKAAQRSEVMHREEDACQSNERTFA